MGAFVNNSSVSLITGAYRTTVPYAGYFGFMKSLSEVTRTYGQYVNLHEVNTGNDERIIRIAASDYEGYLVGEQLLQHVDHEHILYCEQVAPEGDSLVVCIRNRKVIFDAYVEPGPLEHDLLLDIVADPDIKYHLMIAGSQPIIGWGDDVASYTVPGNRFTGAERLDRGFFLEAHAPSKQFLVTSSSKASDIAGLRSFSPKKLAAAVAAIAVIGIGGSYAYSTYKEQNRVVEKTVVDLYKDYRTALGSPSPAGCVAGTASLLARASSIPGWKVKDVGLSDTNVYAEVELDGGSIAALEEFAQAENLVIRRKDSATVLYDVRPTIPRNFADEIFQIQDVLNHITDIANVMYDASVEAKQMTVQGKVYTRDITISINSALIDDIAMFAESLADLPITLKSVSGKPSGDYFQMKVVLTIWGDHVRSMPNA